tara:strand:- start:768 stop:2303 length:1536 start_codon:yes stop_codon:yes gene_type:complete
MASPAALAKLITKGKNILRYHKEASKAKRFGKAVVKKRKKKATKKVFDEMLSVAPGDHAPGETSKLLIKQKIKDVIKNPKKEAKKLKEAYKKTGGIKHVIARTTKPGYKRTKRGAIQGQKRDNTSFGHSEPSPWGSDSPNWAGHGDKGLANVLQRRASGYIETPDPGVGSFSPRPFLMNTADNNQILEGLKRAGLGHDDLTKMMDTHRWPKEVAPRTTDVVRRSFDSMESETKGKILKRKGKLRKAVEAGDERKIRRHRTKLARLEGQTHERKQAGWYLSPDSRAVTRHERAHAIHQENSIYQMVSRLHRKEKGQILAFWRNKQAEALINGDRSKVDKYERAITAVEDLGSGSLPEVLRSQGLAGLPARVNADIGLIAQTRGNPLRSSAQDIQNLGHSMRKLGGDAPARVERHFEDLQGLSSLLSESGARASEITGMRGPLQGLRRARIGFTSQVLDPYLSGAYAAQSPSHAWALKKARPAAYAAKYAPHAGLGTLGAGGAYLTHEIMEDD